MALVVAGCATKPTTLPGPSIAEIESMTQANVGDSVIIAQIENSDARYTLNASQIIALKKAGVSDEVIKAMLNTNKRPVVQTVTVYLPSYPYPYYGFWPWWGTYYTVAPKPCPAPKPSPPPHLNPSPPPPHSIPPPPHHRINRDAP